jgi:hypothetical protein
MLNEDWDVLVSFFPPSWRWLAGRSRVLKGARKGKSAASFIRVLLLHVANGLSLRETAVRAREGGLADLSDVAVLKRLRKSRNWLRQLCLALFRERGLPLGRRAGLQLRVFDATNVKEPGRTGSVWRIHYSVQIPSLECDFFKLTGTSGEGTGETFRQFPVNAGDYILADRGYSHGAGISHIALHQAYLCVRLNSQSLPLLDPQGEPFPLFERLKTVEQAGQIACWPVGVAEPGAAVVRGRLCVVRKTQAAAAAEIRRCKRLASKKQHGLKPETLVMAQYVALFTTFPEDTFSPEEVLSWYRMRWQVELVFKRFKQLARLGHLPKHDQESSQAWLYGKLFVALLTEKIIGHARTLSPWGYELARVADAESLA